MISPGTKRVTRSGCLGRTRTAKPHYRVDKDGLITWVNLPIATGQNNLAMNRAVAQVARHYVRDGALTDGVLNRVEASIRAFDPCLSCSTHAVGKMPLILELRGPDGALLDRLTR